MKEVYLLNSDDELCAYIYCESVMNIRPWRLWIDSQDHLKVEPNPDIHIMELKVIMEKHFKENPNHAGLRHLYIHLMELSPTPEFASDKLFPSPLNTLAPDLGHLCHMATHIDILEGDYERCVELNIKAS